MLLICSPLILLFLLCRDEPGDWIDSSLEELHVYTLIADSILDSLLDAASAEVEMVLAKRAMRM
jgi:hypothetical protein